MKRLIEENQAAKKTPPKTGAALLTSQ